MSLDIFPEKYNWPSAIVTICTLIATLITLYRSTRTDRRSASNSKKLDKYNALTEDTSCKLQSVEKAVNGRVDLLLKTHADLALARYKLIAEASPEFLQKQEAEYIIFNNNQRQFNASKLFNNIAGATMSNRILVVEDCEPDAELFVRVLRELHFIPTVAKNSVEVVSYMSSEKYDAAFIDLNLPGSLNGYDLIKIMTVVNPEMPLFVITGYTDPSIEKAVKLLGAIALMRKPVSGDDLRNLLSSLVQKNQPI